MQQLALKSHVTIAGKMYLSVAIKPQRLQPTILNDAENLFATLATFRTLQTVNDA